MKFWKMFGFVSWICAIALVFLTAACPAQAEDIGLWKRFEVSYSNTSWSGNPFDLILTGEFTHTSSGRKLTQLGFYAGSDTWKIYFMPDRLGQWTFTTQSPDGDLNGRSGSFRAVASGIQGMLAADGNRWKLSEGKHSLPVIWEVADLWEFRAGQVNDPEVVHELDLASDTAGAQLLAQQTLMLAEGRSAWYGDAPQDAVPFVAGQEGETFHLPFWDRLNDKLDAARDRGMGMYHMFYADDGDKPNNFGIGLQSPEEQRLFRYAIARLAPYPIVLWDTGIDIVEYRSNDWVDWFVDYFQQHDPWQHPVSSRNSPGPIPAAETYRSAGINGDGENDIPSRSGLVNLFNASTVPLALNDHYRVGLSRGNWDNDAIRRVMWRLGLSGHESVLIDYSQGDPPSSTVNEGAAYVGHATTFFSQHIHWGLEALEPHDGWLSSSSNGNIGSDVILSANPGKEYVVYAKFGGSFDVNLTSATQLSSRWYNPRTGTFSGQGTITGGGISSFTAPSAGTNQDWVLHLYASIDGTPPSAPTGVSAVVISGQQIDLSWNAASDPDSGIASYVIFRDSVSVGTSTVTSFSDTGLQGATLYRYEVAAVNGGATRGPKSSPPVQATTMGDTNPPELASVDDTSANTVAVVFNEPVETASAELATNYAISGGIQVISANLAADLVAVTLSTSALTQGETYTLTVNNVRDRSAARNEIVPNTQATFVHSARVNRGLVALYDFAEEAGTTVHDTSGVGTPLNLTVDDSSRVSWLQGGLSINASTIVSSAGAATKVISAVQATDKITVESWLRPDSAALDGPARIVTLSSSTSSRNFTLGQSLAAYDFRLRTTSTSVNGVPSITTGDVLQPGKMTHVVYTRDSSGAATVYLDGIAQAAGTVSGNLSNWDLTQRLGLANEFSMTRSWQGELHLVAIYSSVLSAAEVLQNHAAGPGGTTRPDTTAPAAPSGLKRRGNS